MSPSVVFEKVRVILDIAGTSPAQYDTIKNAFFTFYASDTTHLWTYLREVDVMFQWLSHEQGNFQVKVNLDKCPTLVALICGYTIAHIREGSRELSFATPSGIFQWAQRRYKRSLHTTSNRRLFKWIQVWREKVAKRKKLLARKLPPELVSMIWKSM